MTPNAQAIIDAQWATLAKAFAMTTEERLALIDAELDVLVPLQRRRAARGLSDETVGEG